MAHILLLSYVLKQSCRTMDCSPRSCGVICTQDNFLRGVDPMKLEDAKKLIESLTYDEKLRLLELLKDLERKKQLLQPLRE